MDQIKEILLKSGEQQKIGVEFRSMNFYYTDKNLKKFMAICVALRSLSNNFSFNIYIDSFLSKDLKDDYGACFGVYTNSSNIYFTTEFEKDLRLYEKEKYQATDVGSNEIEIIKKLVKLSLEM